MFVLAASLRKHPFLLALRCLGRCERTGNVCNSATEIPYWWRKICFSYCLRTTDKRQKATIVKWKREESLTKQSIFWVSLELVDRWTQFTKTDQMTRKIGQIYIWNPIHLLCKHWFTSSVWNFCRRCFSARNVPSGEERWETDAFAG